MRLLIVCPYPHGKAPSQRFRFEQYLDGLDCQYTIASFWKAHEWPGIYKEAGLARKIFQTCFAFLRRFFLTFQISRYDKVFIHREATPIGPPLFEWITAKIYKKPIVFDFDDAIWLPNSSEVNAKIVGRLKNHGKTAKICSWSKVVTVGNAFLAEYACQFAKDVRVIPTTIDTENLHFPSRHRSGSIPIGHYSDANLITIGWTGSHSTLKQLTPLFHLLKKIHEQYPFRFLLIADSPPSGMPDFVEFRKWKKETEIEDLMEIEIGIMPLYDNDWERGKCGFKALQYMSLEIPTVVSPVGVNKEIVQDGIHGYHAEAMPPSSESDWEKALIHLFKNESLRSQFGEVGREHVKKKYSVVSQKEEYQKILC